MHGCMYVSVIQYYCSFEYWIYFEHYCPFEKQLYSLSHARRPKSAIFGVLSALVKASRQFKQREKRCKFTIIQTTTILKSDISLCGDSLTWER
jgi:hypothetical protein